MARAVARTRARLRPLSPFRQCGGSYRAGDRRTRQPQFVARQRARRRWTLRAARALSRRARLVRRVLRAGAPLRLLRMRTSERLLMGSRSLPWGNARRLQAAGNGAWVPLRDRGTSRAMAPVEFHRILSRFCIRFLSAVDPVSNFQVIGEPANISFRDGSALGGNAGSIVGGNRQFRATDPWGMVSATVGNLRLRDAVTPKRDRPHRTDKWPLSASAVAAFADWEAQSQRANRSSQSNVIHACIWDKNWTVRNKYWVKSLKSLARPRGIEPLFSP